MCLQTHSFLFVALGLQGGVCPARFTWLSRVGDGFSPPTPFSLYLCRAEAFC